MEDKTFRTYMRANTFFIAIFLFIAGFDTGFCEAKKEEALQEVKDFSFVQYKDGGGENWKLKGRSAEVVDDKINIEYLSSLSFCQGTMLKLKARQASFNKGESLVRLRDNVVAATTDGTRLTTDYLEWNTETKDASTDAAVNIKRLDMEVSGIGAVCDIEGRTAELKENINASIQSSDAAILRSTQYARRTTILCNGPLELNYNKNRAVFNKNVKVEDSRGTILAERIDVYFNPANRHIKCVVARGNVRIINGENVTYSDRAIYLVDEGRVILPNRPKLVIQSDNMDGNNAGK